MDTFDAPTLEALDYSTLEAAAATNSFMMAPLDYNNFAERQQVIEPLDLGRGFPISQEDSASQNTSEVDKG